LEVGGELLKIPARRGWSSASIGGTPQEPAHSQGGPARKASGGWVGAGGPEVGGRGGAGERDPGHM
jgi:hypothetical protein